MIQPRLHLLVTIALLGASIMLGGCENTPGYVDKAPPSGMPKESSEMPPGEKAERAKRSAPSVPSPLSDSH